MLLFLVKNNHLNFIICINQAYTSIYDSCLKVLYSTTDNTRRSLTNKCHQWWHTDPYHAQERLLHCVWTAFWKDSSTACEQHSGKTPPLRVNSVLERLLHFVWTAFWKDSSISSEQHSKKTPPFRMNNILERLLHFVWIVFWKDFFFFSRVNSVLERLLHFVWTAFWKDFSIFVWIVFWKDFFFSCKQRSGKTPPFRVNSILERLLHSVWTAFWEYPACFFCLTF